MSMRLLGFEISQSPGILGRKEFLKHIKYSKLLLQQVLLELSLCENIHSSNYVSRDP